MKRLLVVIAAVLLSCSCNGGRPKPPSPSPTVAPPTTTLPPPVEMLPLRVEGTRFVTDKGTVYLMGAVACCESAKENGWPWANEGFLKKIAEHKGNYVHVRNGPNNGSESPVRMFDGDNTLFGFDGYAKAGEKYDLMQFNADFWGGLRRLILTAQRLGIYVEVDVVDHWVLRKKLSPWYAPRNVQSFEGEDPSIKLVPAKLFHKSWIQKLAAETGSFPNVIYSMGNEEFLPPNTVAAPWADSLVALVRGVEKERGYVRHLIGTNSRVRNIEKSSLADYVIEHGERAVPPRWGKPLIVNEIGDSALNARTWEEQARHAKSIGSHFMLWRGDMLDPEFAAALKAMQRIQGGQ